MHWKTFRVSETFQEFFKVERAAPILSSQWLGGLGQGGTYRWTDERDRKLFAHVARWVAMPFKDLPLSDQTVPFGGLGVEGALARSVARSTTSSIQDAGSLTSGPNLPDASFAGSATTDGGASRTP